MGSDGEDYNTDEYGYDDPNYNEDEYYLPDTADLQSEKYYYNVLKEEEIKKRQNDDIAQISSVLSVPRKSATVLLCSFNWSVSEILDKWFANEEDVRKSVGLVINESENGADTCNICFDRRRFENRVSACCGHAFCKKCYSKYVSVRINDGIGCLLMRCPERNCRVVVDQDFINSLEEFLSDQYRAKYEKFLLRSYVEQSRTRRWCPGPGCKNAVELAEVVCRKNWDVVCDCSHEFCWNCRGEAHSPVDCETVLEWEKKKKSESENVNWILAYTKPCPKCKNQIEKTNGCDHITCRSPCGHQFCWLCLVDWKKHSWSKCNSIRYGKAKHVNKMSKLENSMIRRYEYYFERWNGNQRSRSIAQSDLENFRNVHREKKDLFDNYKKQRIEEAWVQIIECRRVLRWSYVYGYYLQEGETAKNNLFEYLRGQAESALGRLHQCAEEELKPFIDENTDHEFNKYYSELVNLTRVTKNFFENLVAGLQNGLEVGTDN